MKQILEIINLSKEYLKGDRRTAEELLAFVLGCKRLDLYMQFDRPLLEEELVKMRALLKRVAAGEPLQYVTGEVEFYGSKIKVDKRVLIPRPETEIMVDMIAKRVESGVVWDLCTGSGCIGISLKRKKPALQVTISDISKDALALARENAAGLDVEIIEGDLLAPFKGRKADIIICNPPYISTNEYFNLDPSVRDFEPKLALVGGGSGLEFYERLSAEVPSFLNEGGRLFLEIGHMQGEAMKKIFSWGRGELFSDWAGHPRFFFLEKQ